MICLLSGRGVRELHVGLSLIYFKTLGIFYGVYLDVRISGVRGGGGLSELPLSTCLMYPANVFEQIEFMPQVAHDRDTYITL